METITQAFQWLIDFFNTGIYLFFEDLLKEAVAWLVISKIEFQIWSLGFSWDVAKTIMFNLNVSGYIQSAWSSLDGRTLGYLTFFRVPDALNLLIQAYITRITLAVMGW